MPKYIQVPDDYELQEGQTEYTPEDTTGLKNKANDLLAESKKKDATVADLNAQIKKLQVDLNSGAPGDVKKVQAQLDDALSKLGEVDNRYNDLVKANNQGKVDGEANRIAATLTKDTRRAAMLAKEIGGRLSLDGDSGFTVLDTNGNPTVSSTDELVGQVKKDFDFLVDGSQATGGGAQGGGGGAADTKTMKRSDFDALDINGQGKYMASGGKLTDD